MDSTSQRWRFSNIRPLVPRKLLLWFFAVFSLAFTSCGFIISQALFPDMCLKCQLIDNCNESVIWSEDGCGGLMAGMEDRCKVRAYDEFIWGKRVRCSCESYKNPTPQ